MLLGMKPLTHHNLTISAWSLSLTLTVDSRRSALDEPVPEGMPHALPLVARELALGIHVHAPHEHAADALHVVVADALELSNGVGTVGLGVSKCLGERCLRRACDLREMGDPPLRRQSLAVAGRRGIVTHYGYPDRNSLIYPYTGSLVCMQERRALDITCSGSCVLGVTGSCALCE